MKKINLILSMLISVSLIMVSCSKKSDDEVAEDMVNQLLDIKGSIDLNIAGNTYDQLFSSVTFAEAEQMVTFWAINYDSEDSFIVSFGAVPAVGVTANIDPESEDGMIFIITGSFLEGAGYYAQSGTIKRVSTDKYELNIMVNEYTQTGSPISITGTVTVGEHN